jgi:Ca-activated chloride channel family protein
LSFLAALAVVTFSAAAPILAEDAVCRPWQSRETAVAKEAEASAPRPVPLTQLRAHYDVDILGSMALGTVVYEFVNAGEVPAKVFCEAPLGLRAHSVALEVSGEVHKGAAETKAEPKQPAGRQQLRKAKTVPSGVRTKPVEVPAGEIVTFRADFQSSLMIDDGSFQLQLPAAELDREEEPAPAALEALARLDYVASHVTLAIHDDEPLARADSATHQVFVSYEGDRTLVEIGEGERVDREFRFEFALGTEQDANLLGYVGPEGVDGERNVMVVLTPPSSLGEGTVRPKQVLFVLDTSGSMARGKLEQAVQALSSCLDKLRPDDSYNMIEFDVKHTLLSEAPLLVSEVSPQNSASWLHGLRAEGGTRLLPALQATFEQPQDPERHTMIVIITDGAVHDEAPVLELLESMLGEGRLFVVGVGDDVKQETVLRMAEYGRGTAAFATDPQALDAAVAKLFDSVSEPVAWDLALDWGGADVELVKPRRVPDLYAGRPVTVLARVKGEVPAELTVTAKTMQGSRTFVEPLTESADLERFPKLGSKR